MGRNILKYGIFVLATALIIGGSYFGYIKYNESKNQTGITTEQKTIDEFKFPSEDKAKEEPAQETVDTIALQKKSNGTYEPKREYTSEEIKANNEFTAIAPLWTARIPTGTSLDVYLNVKSEAGDSGWIHVERGEGKTNETAANEYFPEVPMLYTGTSYQYRVILATTDKTKTPILEKIRFELINGMGEKTSWEFPSFLGLAKAAAPEVVSRTAWGCPEGQTSPDWTPEYAPVKKIILHHTVSQNNPVDPSADIRAIWYYHAKTLEWGDIGYNYLVDQNGKIYEGRNGGANVIAGHALGFNTGSMGIAALGDFTSTNPTTAAQNALGKIAGQKLFEYGINPLGSGSFSSTGSSIPPTTVTTGNIDGHKVYTATSCPGRIYNFLGSIRSVANSQYVLAQRSQYPVTSPLYISRTNPAVGEVITAGYQIKNNTSEPVTFQYVGVATQINGKPVDLGWKTNVTVAAGATYNVSVQGAETEIGTYNYWAAYVINGVFYNAASETTQTVWSQFTTHRPNIVVTTPISSNPSYPVDGSSATYSMTVVMYEPIRVNYSHLGIPATNNTAKQSQDIGWDLNSYLDPGVPKTVSFDRVMSAGKYTSWPSVIIGGKYYSLYLAGSANKVGYYGFEVVQQLAVLEGIPIPATSGLVGREQHLSVTGCQEQAATHYSLTNAILSVRNGMAWETSGGCGYGAWGVPPYAGNEQYYINMRWNYTNIHGQAILTTKNWYYGKRIIVTNPANGKKVVVSIIEYGPSPSTGRVAGLSPEAMFILGASTNNNLQYYWASNQSIPLGPLN